MKKIIYFRVQLFRLSIFLILAILSCNKQNFETLPLVENNETNLNFFQIKYKVTPEILRIIEQLKVENQKEDFVKKVYKISWISEVG